MAGLEYDCSYPDADVHHIILDWMDNNMDLNFIRCVCIIWNLWKTRNDIIFSRGNFATTKIIKKATQDFELCMENYLGTRISQSSSQQWSPPAPQYVKINVDADFIPNNGAAGAVARDQNGNFLGCTSTTFMVTSSLLAEAMACNLGIQLGLRFNFSKIEIEGDAANVTEAVLGEVRNIPWSIRSKILKIKDVVHSFEDVKFQHVPKDVNFLAHSLCQYAMHNNVNIWWNANSPPSCISSNLN
ncbi:uncharacterized protein LOC113290696 [Papaver somniferum]|uniref:uncharacterized protein LOC113290696 n=1 Tax=Papaver somniferum TaxID=3469 RepID=UPI000E6F7AF4|nr:uncharacterized protein LOC113290696 [Papaver somniferum]